MHGRVSEEGVVPLAPSFDTVGWFSQDPEILKRVGEALFIDHNVASAPTRILVAEDAFAIAGETIREREIAWIQGKAKEIGASVEFVKLAHTSLEEYRELFLFLQPREVGLLHTEWVNKVRPSFGVDIAARFKRAAELANSDASSQKSARQEAKSYMIDLLDAESVICLPSTFGTAPLIDCSDEEAREFRAKTMMLTSPAGLAGLPQINIPGDFSDDHPAGIGFIALNDEILLQLACHLA
jgi:amidase